MSADLPDPLIEDEDGAPYPEDFQRAAQQRIAEAVRDAAPVVMTLYRTKVHASNRNSDYGTPVDVYASSRSEAVSRAIDVGWNGHRSDARVTVLSVEQAVL